MANESADGNHKRAASGREDPLVTTLSIIGDLNAADKDRQRAWKRFCERYGPVIAGFARQMHVRGHDVDDLVQDVLSDFNAKSGTFAYDPARGRFRGFLKVCTWRKLKDKMKRRGIKIDGRPIEEIDESAVQVEQVWNDTWEHEKLQRAIAHVRERYLSRPDSVKTYRAFELVVIVGRSVEDVSATLSIPVNSVHAARSRVSRAIQKRFAEMDEGIE